MKRNVFFATAHTVKYQLFSFFSKDMTSQNIYKINYCVYTEENKVIEQIVLEKK